MAGCFPKGNFSVVPVPTRRHRLSNTGRCLLLYSAVIVAKVVHEKALYLHTTVPGSRPICLHVDYFGCVRCCVRGALAIRLWRQYMAGMVRAGDIPVSYQFFSEESRLTG
jgi:hypothetical protein